MDFLLDILGKLGFDWRVALANLINFLIIFWILNRFVFRPLAQTIASRQEKIAQGIESSERADGLLVRAKEEARSLVDDAKKQAAEIIQHAGKQAENVKQDIEKRAYADADQIVADARIVADAMKQSAELEVERHAAVLISQGVTKVIEDTFSEAEHRTYMKKVTEHIA
jgi:F-type H+-transporting ATPase subunit b